MTNKRHILVLAVALALTSGASAFGEIGPYVGISAGLSQVELDLRDAGGVDFELDEDDSAFRVFFGVELLGPLAVEIGYRDLGTVTDSNGFTTVTSESDGLDAFAVGSVGLGPVALFAKGGLILWDSSIETRSSGILGAPDIRLEDDGESFAWGVGVKFEIRQFAFRAEWEQLDMDVPDDVSVVSVGVAYEF